MSNNEKHTQSKQSGTPNAGLDPVAAIQKVARALPAAEPMTTTKRQELRNVVGRAPAKLIALVLSEAEERGGSVAGVPIDATTSRDALAQASRLRVGAAAARTVARHLEQEALSLAFGVAQQALSATTSLEAFARTPAGRSHAAKAAELRTAARGTKRRSKAKNANGTTSSAGSAAATSTEAGPKPAASDATVNGAGTNGAGHTA